MLTKPLPKTSAELADASWATISGWYDDLAETSLQDVSLDDWLSIWSRLDELVTEAASMAMISYTCDTANPQKEAAHLRFSTEILPQLEEKEVILARRFVAHGTERADLQTTLRRFRVADEIFREENIPLIARAESISSRYQQVTGGMTADWEGRKVPLPQLAPFLKSPERSTREAAWRAGVAPYVAAHDELAGQFSQLASLRQQVASNSGFDDYRDYIFKAKCRFDYTPTDCERLHQAIEEAVVPAVERVMAVRSERLGIPVMRPWDMAVDPFSASAPLPFATVEEFKTRAGRIFREISPELGEQFKLMTDEGLLDLESRAGKAPGGYCDTLHAQGRPFVFMNAAGVPEDVTTLHHEAGHCFHAFASHANPLIWQRHPGAESAELASMSMELLASPYLGKPIGYYEAADANAARLEHLENLLSALSHIASVDAFQSWLYTEGRDADPAGRDACWLRLRDRFERGVSWQGLETERISRWYRQLHIFLYPFYYIEYAIAQIGALQVWRNARNDRQAAISDYRRFLALGATQPLPELYRAAGVKLSFDVALLKELVTMVEDEMSVLRDALTATE